jgi:hypothetical protein
LDVPGAPGWPAGRREPQPVHFARQEPQPSANSSSHRTAEDCPSDRDGIFFFYRKQGAPGEFPQAADLIAFHDFF